MILFEKSQYRTYLTVRFGDRELFPLNVVPSYLLLFLLPVVGVLKLFCQPWVLMLQYTHKRVECRGAPPGK